MKRPAIAKPSCWCTIAMGDGRLLEVEEIILTSTPWLQIFLWPFWSPVQSRIVLKRQRCAEQRSVLCDSKPVAVARIHGDPSSARPRGRIESYSHRLYSRSLALIDTIRSGALSIVVAARSGSSGSHFTSGFKFCAAAIICPLLGYCWNRNDGRGIDDQIVQF